MSNLGGELRISNLENVVNVQDVKDVGLKLKDKLERLTLIIFRYGGPEFPYWIKNGSFSKMVNLRLLDCKKCTSLPCLGQLSSLKQLLISGNDGVTNVGTEFYGETCFSYWEDWSSPTKSLFTCLRELTILSCPKLIKKLPTYLPSLTKLFKLTVDECNETVLRSGIELTSLIELRVSGILELIKLQQGFVWSLGGLQALKFSECEELTCLWEDGFESESLHCHQLVPSRCNLRSLKISSCDKLERLPNGWQSLACLEELKIKYCPKLVSFPESKYVSSLIGFPRGRLPITLKELYISDCEKLESLPEGIMHYDSTNVAALQSLAISHCSSLTSFLRGKFPSTLKGLNIWDCEHLESISEEMFHSTNNSFQSLSIVRYPNLRALPNCLYNLTDLYIANNKNLELLPPIKNLTLSYIVFYLSL
ncbi:hypothetical protein AAG906_013191 [Vitis piasezkii]